MFAKVRRFWSKLRSSSRTKDEAQRNAALFRLSAELAAASEEKEVCTRVVEGLHATLGYDYVALTLLEEETSDRVRMAGVGYEGSPARLHPGQGLSERPLFDGQIHYTPDVSMESAYIPGIGGSEVDVPIQIGKHIIGVLVAESRHLDDFDQEDFEVLTAAAQQTGLALEKVRLLTAERKRADELDALYTTLTEITAELDLQTLLQAIIERAAGLMGASGGELGLYDEDNQVIRIVVSHNLGGDYVGTSQECGEGAMGKVIETGQPLILDDYQTWEGGLPQYPNIHASLAVPLRIGERLVGVFTTVSKDPERRFMQADLDFLTLFAQQAVVVIENARLFKKAQLEIAERAKIEAEILHQKEYFEALFINSPIAVVTADLEGIVVSWNPMAEKLFGYTQAEVVGRNLDDIVAADKSVHGEAQGYTEQVISTGQVQATVRRTRKDGTFIDAELLALPVIVSGEKVGFIAIYHDISERIRMEREIRHQKEYFEALFINNPVAVITVNLDGRVISWNPAAAKLFGYTQEEAIGTIIDKLVAKDPDIHAEALFYTDQATREGRAQAITKRNRKDGSLVDVELLALPVLVGGEKVGYIGIYYDISDLQEARRQAEAANQAKSAFLANMSHELRTPLNAILGFTRLMNSDPLITELQRENLTIINHSGEHLLNLINSVLEMSKIEAGRVMLQEKSFDLHLLLDTLEEMFRLRAQEKGLGFVFERDALVPQYIMTDDGKLRQVLMNLIGNAIKFTETGRVTHRVSASYSDKQQHPEHVKLHFEIHDTGPGIAPDELSSIFEPFVQAKYAPHFQEGTGLGLSISRQFVRMLGGDICATSTIGQGSLFSFDLIVKQVEESEFASSQFVRRALSLQADQPLYRLLVVEDRKTNRQLLVKILQSLGFDVKEATNGHQAIEIWEQWKPHLIWMDIQMPNMDGYETTRHIKSSKDGLDTVIIALTATAFEEDRQKTISAGCDDFLRKPFRQEEITRTLEKHLGAQFVYEDEEPRTLVSPPSPKTTTETISLTSESLATIPPDLITELEREIIRADMHRIHETISKINEQDEHLAASLGEMANKFEHDQILALIKESKIA